MTYVPALSGLRTVACLAVVLFHCKIAWGLGGFHGVDVFFVLSGYLTTRILSNDTTSFDLGDAFGFVIRRAWRIMPLLIVVTLGSASLIAIVRPDEWVWVDVILPIALISNFGSAMKSGPDYMLHAWSVASEMQFYAAIAILFIAMSRVRKSIGFAVFLSLFIAVTLARFGAFYEGWPWPNIYFSPILRLSGLLLGAALAMLPFALGTRVNWIGWPALAVIAMAFAMADYRSAISFTIWGTAVELATAVLIAIFVASPGCTLARALSGKWIERMGLWSYGIYLWHYPIARLLRDDLSPELTFAITLTTSTVLAAVTYRFVEQRFRYGAGVRTDGDAAGAFSSLGAGLRPRISNQADRATRAL